MVYGYSAAPQAALPTDNIWTVTVNYCAVLPTDNIWTITVVRELMLTIVVRELMLHMLSVGVHELMLHILFVGVRV
jgi:hypothetical protein